MQERYMKSKLLTKTFAALALVGAFTAASGQSTQVYDPSQGNPYIKVPPSSRYVRGVNRTHCLIYTGVPAAPGFAPATLGGFAAPGVTHGPALLAPAIPGYHPQDIRTAYNLPSDGGSGAIAIVDAFNLSSVLSDFN